jgi:hypothetical protein
MKYLNLLSIKKILPTLCLFILLLFSSTKTFATHGSGANLTYTCLGANQYELSLVLYRDCNGVNLPGNQTISWSSICATGNISATRTSIVDVTPLSPYAQSPCTTGSGGLGRQMHTYSATITLPAGCTDILFSYRLCCRINSATTVNNPSGGEAIYVDAFLDSVGSCNNTPIFLNPPLFYNCVNNPILYNPGVVDFDGDSLVFSLVDALSDNGSPISYLPGFDGLNFLGTSVPVNIDPATGIMTFTPTNIVVAYLCIRIDEYRNGVHVGYIKRDAVYHVIPCTNTPPILSGIDSTTLDSLSICVGSQVCFDVYAVDTNLTDSIVLSLNSSLPNSSFLTSPGTTDNLAMGTFCWTPTLADTGLHQINILANDHSLPICGHTYRTYQIQVISNTNDPVHAGFDINLCEIDTSILTATSTSPSVVSYEWTSATGTIINPNNFSTSVISTTSATYQVLATYSDGCNYIDSVNVNIDTITATITNINDATSLFPPDGSASVQTQGGTGAYTYDWGTNAGNQTTATATGLSNDTYCVLVTDSLGCSDTACVFIAFYSSINSTTSKEPILLFPNPAQDEIALDCANLMGSKRIEIYDILGQVVYSNVTSDQQIHIPTRDWSEGIYVLKLFIGKEELFSKKISVQR